MNKFLDCFGINQRNKQNNVNSDQTDMNIITDETDARRYSESGISFSRNSESGMSIARRLSSFAIKYPTGVKLSRPTDETHYKNDHPNIGIALIFNHNEVPNLKPREGAKIDRMRIENALHLYGFDVRSYEDLPCSYIEDILREVSEEDHSNNDCLVVVVMSHGLSGFVFAADRPYPVETLWINFIGENCPTLINKPKLFFIQACRGNKADVGSMYTVDCSTTVTSHANYDETDSPITYTIPSTADMLMFYSTFEGYASFRNKQMGSWFIQALSRVLEKHLKYHQEIELYNFVTSVNRIVAYEYQSFTPEDPKYNDMKAMSNFTSTLTKQFILRAKPK